MEGLTHDAAHWKGDSLEDFEAKAATVGILATEDEDIRSLRELITYGLKGGMAAYACHANVLAIKRMKSLPLWKEP